MYLRFLALNVYPLFFFSLSLYLYVVCMYKCTGVFKTGRVDSLITIAGHRTSCLLIRCRFSGACLSTSYGPQFLVKYFG